MLNLVSALRKMWQVVVLLIILTLVSPEYATAQEANNTVNLETALAQQLTKVATAALNAQLDVLTNSVSASANVQQYAVFYQAAIQQQVAEATTRRVALLADGIIYGTYNLQVTVTDLQIDGDVVLLFAQEYTAIKLDNSEIDALAPETTEYIDDHTFRFQLLDGNWFLVEDSVRMPPNLPIDPTLGPVIDPPTTVESEPILSFVIYMPFVSTSEQSVQSADVQEILVDRSAVAAYARLWWNTANPAYRNWLPDNDCTNFVSQSLKNGGWQYTTRYPSSKWWTSAWWYASDDQTRAWTAADWFYSFIPSRATLAPQTSDLRVGDVLQIDWTGDGSVDHATIVTKKDSNNRLYLTYHSNNRLDKPLSDIVAQYPKAKYYGWKLN